MTTSTDPYAPPQASLAGPTRAELSARANGAMSIASIGQRMGASLIDFVIVLPLVVLEIYLSTQTRLAELYMLVPYQLLVIYLFIVMVRTHGGSPGKRLTGLRIVMLDGAPVTWKASVLRYSVYLILGLLISAAEILTAWSMPDDAYLALGYLERIDALELHAPWWTDYATYALMAWVCACAIALLSNQRRRSLYDYQAGTIVVRRAHA
ncbi:MAG TPA: RDD family protein [Telluria sp.]|jgi:uncharacterized RDD family membrane protein YckC